MLLGETNATLTFFTSGAAGSAGAAGAAGAAGSAGAAGAAGSAGAAGAAGATGAVQAAIRRTLTNKMEIKIVYFFITSPFTYCLVSQILPLDGEQHVLLRLTFSLEYLCQCGGPA